MAFIISHKYKFSYVHIPKTGGTTICTSKTMGWGILDYLLGEDDIALGHEHISMTYDFPYPVWTSIREPYDRAVAIYYDQNRNYGWGSFDRFCDALDGKSPLSLSSQIVWPQCYFLTNLGEDKIMADEFILFDKMYEGVRRLLTSIEVEMPKELPHLQDGRVYGRVKGGKLIPDDLDDHYTDKTREIIRSAYAKDFELYERVKRETKDN